LLRELIKVAEEKRKFQGNEKDRGGKEKAEEG